MNPRLLYISINPIQNAKPYRLLEQRDDLDSLVLYLQQPDAKFFTGKENITKQAFDNDLLSGYQHVFLEGNKPLFGKKKGFFSFCSFKVIPFVRNSDIVIIYGHSLLTFWIAMLAAKWYRKKLVLTTDATYMEGTAESGGWKMKIKPMFLRWLYNRWANAVLVPSSAAKLFLESVGIISNRIGLSPYVVDEDLIEQVSAATDIPQFRSRRGIDKEAIVFVFCAKFIERKRPLDAVEAFAKINNTNARLILIGDGPLKESIQERIAALQLQDKVVLPGIVKYTELPSYYTIADALVFCSDHEPYGLPVNEAMLCGTPAIVSDKIGARLDLVEEGKTGWIYPAGNTEALAGIMQKVVDNAASLPLMGEQAKKKMLEWSSSVNVALQLGFFKAKGWM